MTKIQWTEQTWNPIVGCSIVSPGCANCYAMRMAGRIQKMNGPSHYDGTTKVVNGNTVWTGRIGLAPDKTIMEPVRRKKPTMYFVNSMSDVFHESIPDPWVDRVFAVMAFCGNHTFQVLTKRADIMRHTIARIGRSLETLERPAREMGLTLKFEGKGFIEWPLRNVWLGISAERQQEWDQRTEHLRNTRAVVRFVSAEPLLGPIDARPMFHRLDHYYCDENEDGPIHRCRPGIDWLICGGESGPAARDMNPDWARSLRDQCTEHGVAFFQKQMARRAPIPDDLLVRQYPDGRHLRQNALPASL